MEKRKLWQQALTAAGVVAAVWLSLWLLGPVLAPFGVGLLLAKAASPAIRGLTERMGLPRWLAAGISVTGLYLLGAGTLWLLCRLLCRELFGLLQSLPGAVQALTGPARQLEQRLLQAASRFPDGIGLALEQSVREFFRSGAGLPEKAYQGLFTLASGLLRRTPDLLLFLLTAVLSSFMLAVQLPTLTALWRKKAPAQWQQRGTELGRRLKQTLGGWLLTQLKLMGITALVLTAGLLVLQVDYPLVLGLASAGIDALPVLGSGIILIPWGLFRFLQGNTAAGVGLLVLYGVSALLRTALEPRLLGKQMGLDPLLTLAALYGGYHFLGLPGMILFPIGAMLLKQFWAGQEERPG